MRKRSRTRAAAAMNRPANASEIVRAGRPIVSAGCAGVIRCGSIAITTTAPGHFGGGFVSAAVASSETSRRSVCLRFRTIFPATFPGSEIAVRWSLGVPIPAKLNMDVVKSAALRCAETEVEDEGLHPECLVTTMPYALAEEWQKRLLDMNEDQRCADRAVLLDENFSKKLNKGKVGGCCGHSTSPNF
jgi:hypothetical protein